MFLNLNKPNYLQVEDTGSEGATGDHRSTNRQRRRKVRVPRTVVNPDENFYFYWLWVITACVLYNLWTLIVRQSFPELQVTIIHHPSLYIYYRIERLGCSSQAVGTLLSTFSCLKNEKISELIYVFFLI